MTNKLVTYIIMTLLHRNYKKYNNDIFFIKGTDDKYPRYLLYTEKESISKRMEEF